MKEKGECKDIQKFERTLENLYQTSRNKMSVKDNSYTTYYDKRVRDSILFEGNSVYKVF